METVVYNASTGGQHDLDLKLVKSLLKKNMEEIFGACRILSLQVEDAQLYLCVLIKGVRIEQTLQIDGIMDENRLVDFILSKIWKALGIPFS